MSKNILRKDKTCLNCNYVVENRFCPNCGQENIDTRKTFHHLFVHFFEDLTHYENAFWKTIKNLIFKPGALTREYLSGKRMSYLAPVRLYIFISFVTFLVAALLPEEGLITSADRVQPGLNSRSTYDSPMKIDHKSINDSIRKAMAQDSVNRVKRFKVAGDTDVNVADNFWLVTEKQADSLQSSGNPKDKLPNWLYKIKKKAAHVGDRNSTEEIGKKFAESFAHNFPKVLFIYMPIFAFVLWLFQNKRRWYYFDHGIFTLHYFSFLLLCVLISNLFSALMGLIGDYTINGAISGIFSAVVYVYMAYYFFPAHHRFYEERRGMTILKGLTMFFINSILAGIIMLAFIIYTFINIH